MKRSWTTISLIVGLAGLLVLLGGLQHGWLSQINASENEKAHKRAQEQADRFAMDFNREIQNAYFNFQIDAETWRNKDWSAFNERFDFWKEKTAYPGLISEFYFFEAKPETAPLVFDRGSRSFITTDLTPPLEAIREFSFDEKIFKPVEENSLSLILPIYDAERKLENIIIRRTATEKMPPIPVPPKFGFLVIKLDPAIIKDELLRDLIAKYYPDDEFRVSITDKQNGVIFQTPLGGERDATAPLLDLSPENFIFYGNKDLMKSVEGEKRQAVVLNSRVESLTLDHTAGNDENGTVKIEIKKDLSPRTSVFTATGKTSARGESPWTLGIQHSSGSLDAFMASTLRRNLAIGFGILFLLAAAIAAIIISAQRAKMLARRQIEFVSSVSHEFRTPLAVIYSAGENLADGVAKEDQQVSRYGDLIKGEGKKLSSMVEQILEFAGANAGRRRFNFSVTSVNEVVDNAMDECRPLINEKNMAVVINIPTSLPLISVDKAALSQAIQNLVVNSIKYSDGGGWLRVSAENGGGKVKISVEDHGIGISKSDLSRIFEPFYRANEVVDAQIHGNGLGLSLVKQIAEAHGGRVFASSQVGKGSTFTIELPQN